jgi:diadenosine tetraphosphate (Ap4A) HIT family hydrolase
MKNNKIYENSYLYIEKEISEIPWLKIFMKQNCKELSDCDKKTRDMLFETILQIENIMISYYKPTKINIAIFGNYLPKLHVHIMARFKNDSFFPEPMWGKKQREANLILPEFNKFRKILLKKLMH